MCQYDLRLTAVLSRWPGHIQGVPDSAQLRKYSDNLWSATLSGDMKTRLLGNMTESGRGYAKNIIVSRFLFLRCSRTNITADRHNKEHEFKFKSQLQAEFLFAFVLSTNKHYLQCWYFIGWRMNKWIHTETYCSRILPRLHLMPVLTIRLSLLPSS